MAVEIEIDIICPVTDNELYALRDMLRKEVAQLAQVNLKTKPAQPGEMGDGLLEAIISATVTGTVSVALEQFYLQVWEPKIAPLIFDRWLKKKDSPVGNEPGDKKPPVIFEVSLSDGSRSHRFGVDMAGKKHVTDLQSYTINPQKTYAVLIGCSEYEDGLPGIPPIKTNLEKLEEVFTGVGCMAIPADHVVSLWNTDHKKIKRTLLDMSRKEEMDTLLIYFAGHGYRAGTKDLFLLVKDSSKLSDSEYLQAIEYDFIKKILKGATAKQKILILDACHSGLATLSVTPPMMESEGAYILASSQGHEVSYFDPSHSHTYFTGALLEVLQKGVENYKEKISLDDVYEKTKQLLTEKGFPQPVRCKKLNIHPGHYFLCPNPTFSLATLRDAVKQIKAAGRHEDAWYELELLIKRFPEDAELREMQRTYSPDTLLARLIEEGNVLFYKQIYDKALEKYTRALGLRHDVPEVREKIRQCENAILARAQPLGTGEGNGIKKEPVNQPVEEGLPAETAATKSSGLKKSVIIFSFAVVVILLAWTAKYLRREETFQYGLQIQWTDTTRPVFGKAGIRQFDKKEAGNRTDSALITEDGYVEFQLPVHLRNNPGRIVLLGDLGQEYEVLPEQQRITVSDNGIYKVSVRRKVSPSNSPQPAKKPTVAPVVPRTREGVKAQIPEELNGAIFDSLASSNSLRIFSIQKNTCSIIGRICGCPITAQLKFDGTTFTTLPGDVQGRFSLYDNNTQIIGTLLVKSSHLSCNFTLTRATSRQ